MAKDKRHPTGDLNDIQMNDTGAMTDQERAKLQSGMPSKRLEKPKRAM